MRHLLLLLCAFTLAGAGALSSSAFVIPVLKQKGWEERADGTAALAVLLLQVSLRQLGREWRVMAA